MCNGIASGFADENDIAFALALAVSDSAQAGGGPSSDCLMA
jgi:hypothetical protein